MPKRSLRLASCIVAALGLLLAWRGVFSLPLTEAPAAASASNATSPQPLKLYATIESVGVSAPYQGDANNNSTVVVHYRTAGTPQWWEGHPMTKDRSAREWRVSLVYLSPDTEYEVRVQFQDPDGVSPTAVYSTVRTRPNYPHIGSSGKVWTVPTDGSLPYVLSQSKPGDTIQLLSGVYRENDIVLNDYHSGQPGKYKTIEAAPGAKVIFDGSDQGVNSSGDDWKFYKSSSKGDIYYTDLPWGDTTCDKYTMPGYVGEQAGQDGTRYLLFDSGTDDWKDDFLSAPAGKAYYVCDAAGPGPKRRLYVVTLNGDDPDNREMHVARYTQAFRLVGADYIRIRNLEFRYYGWFGIKLAYSSDSGADHNVIEGNVFHGIGRQHIRAEGKLGLGWVADNLIQYNHFYETGYRDSGWEWAVEYFRGRGDVQGVQLRDVGHGNVIRFNRFDSGHDGIQVNNRSHGADIHDNVINECMDDGIEVDNSPGQNVRLWNNRINYCYTGISLQDWNGQSHGPVYIFRNVIRGGDDPHSRTDHLGGTSGYVGYTAFKVGSDQMPDGWVYIYHNTVSLVRSTTSGDGLRSSGGSYFANTVTRNNIWHVTGRVIKLDQSTAVVNHDFDCDNLHNLYPDNGKFVLWNSSGGPSGDGSYRSLSEVQTHLGQEMRGISDTRTAFKEDLSLDKDSPDVDAGCIVTGFNDRGPNRYRGFAPDIGAFELEYGFHLYALPSAHAVEPDTTAEYVLYLEPAGGFTETVTLTPASPPPSLTLDMPDTTLGPNAQITLRLTNRHTGTMPIGVFYSLPITATSSELTRTIHLGLLVGGTRHYLMLIARNSQP